MCFPAPGACHHNSFTLAASAYTDPAVTAGRTDSGLLALWLWRLTAPAVSCLLLGLLFRVLLLLFLSSTTGSFCRPHTQVAKGEFQFVSLSGVL